MLLTTQSGRALDIERLRPSDIDIKDIANALSNLCRFGGHTRIFYSVAQHSVRVSYAVPVAHQFCALMHDATEAYLCDLPRPIKLKLPDYEIMEHKVWKVIAHKYNLPVKLPPEVKEADDRALRAEFKELMRVEPPDNWFSPGCKPLGFAAAVPSGIARNMFLHEFHRHWKEE